MAEIGEYLTDMRFVEKEGDTHHNGGMVSVVSGGWVDGEAGGNKWLKIYYLNSRMMDISTTGYKKKDKLFCRCNMRSLLCYWIFCFVLYHYTYLNNCTAVNHTVP